MTTASPTRSEDRVPFSHMLIYGAGAFVNNLLAGAFGAMMIILNLGLGMDPALVGLVASIPRFFDALTDPVMGYISDNTRSRWGRRRPYIFVGAIAVGIVFMAIWQLPDGQSEMFYFWFFLLGSLVFYTAYTIFATPWVALGYEITPDYHERTRLMGTQNFIGQLAYFIPPWLLPLMQDTRYFDNMVDGAGGLAIALGVLMIAGGVLPAIFLRERARIIAMAEMPMSARQPGWSIFQTAAHRVRDFFEGFAKALSFKPFLKLCLATFLVFNGFILVASFSTYVIIYYVCAGDTLKGAEYAAYAGTLGTLSTFVVIAFVTWLATRIGKRLTFAISTSISMLGYVLKWFCYQPDNPWLVVLPAPLLAFGLGGLFTLMPSMMADIVDLDELETHERREGMYGSIYWWVVKLGMTAALAGGGFLLNATGFKVELGGAQAGSTINLLRLCDAFIPVIASAIAIWAVATLGIDQQAAEKTRKALDARRHKPDPVAA
ncbi:MAG: MFS transporter [Hyphomonas sp.]|nr:MFS transporter [Hyphomonas sp.]